MGSGCDNQCILEEPSYLRGGKVSVADSQDAVGPFVGNWVKLTVQLSHGDGFRIDNCDLHFVFLHQALRSHRSKKKKMVVFSKRTGTD